MLPISRTGLLRRATRMRAVATAGLLVLSAIGLAGTPLTAQALNACTQGSPVNCTIGGFEIDGNTISDGGTDWQSASVWDKTNNAATAGAYTPFYDLFNTTADDIMSQGSKESDQTSWQCVNSKAPGKSDLGGPNYTATLPGSDSSDPGTTGGEFAPKDGKSWAGAIWFENTGGKQYLFSNFQRYSVNGDVHLDIEFNKATTLLDGGSGCPTLPVRSQGDVLLTYDTSNGGAIIFVSAFVFNCTTATTTGDPCPGELGSFAPDNANKLVNGSTFAGVANISPASSDAGVTAGAYGEAGLNLTDTIGDFSCGEFGDAYMKTRSAGTSDLANGKAEVKDLTQPVQFNPGLCPTSTLAKFQADETTQAADAAGTDESGATDQTADAALTYNQKCSTALTNSTPASCASGASTTPMSANPGDELSYKLVYKNVGGGTAPNPVVTDSIPAGSSYVGGSQTCPSGTTCIAAATVAANPCSSSAAGSPGAVTALVWCLPAEAPTGAGAGVALYYEVDVNATGTSGTAYIENYGHVTDSQITSDTASNSNYVAAAVLYSPNPALVKKQADVRQGSQKCNTATIGASTPGSVSSNSQCILVAGTLNASPTFVTSLSSNPGPGDTLEYQLTYSNTNGTAPNTNVVVTDAIPSNSTFVNSSCTVSAGSCIADAATAASAKCTDTSATTGVLTVVWCLSSVAVNAAPTLTFQVKLASPLDSGTVITNTANGTSDDGPTGPATVTATVTASPNLGLVKTVGAPFTGGTCPATKTCVTYTLSYFNSGDGGLTGQTITDTFPSGMTFVGASNSGSNSSGTVTWTGISVPAGSSAGSPAGSVTLTLSL